MILPFATGNKGKIKEAQHVMQPWGIDVVQLPLELTEPDVGTIQEVTREKLRQVRKRGHKRAMVDDAGIFFAAYDHFPGILSKRIFERIGYKGLLKLLAGERRDAWFEGAIALLWDGEVKSFSARTTGRVLESPPPGVKAEPGFPFNPLFIPDGADRTLAEMAPAERSQYSYRSQALTEAASWLAERNQAMGSTD